jgi:hypothetical protein
MYDKNLDYYKQNAKIIATALDELGVYYTGGKNAPYIWLECPNGMGSWQFFDYRSCGSWWRQVHQLWQGRVQPLRHRCCQ